MERNRKSRKTDDEGNRIYNNLKEYLEKYMSKPDADPHGTTNFERKPLLH